jgi:hypothetical protein
MTEVLVPVGFDVPRAFKGTGFRLEPLGSKHNERDFEAWMSSIEHIHATPGFDGPDAEWPAPMTIEENLGDLVRHAEDFESRTGFTYSIRDRSEVIGCLYIYPSTDPNHDARVTSWVRASRPEMDVVVWREVSQWLSDDWPFTNPRYDARV